MNTQPDDGVALGEPARALVAWMSEEEAFNSLLGRVPGPKDDLASLKGRFAGYRGALEARPIFEDSDLGPIEGSDDPRLVAAAGRPELQAMFANMVWRLAKVD